MIPPLVSGSLKKCQLLQSMEPEISSEYLLLQTAKEIQNFVAQTYALRGIIVQIYDLKCYIH